MKTAVPVQSPVEPPHTPTRGWVKAILVFGCLLMAAMWIYYFAFASDKGVYQMEDTSWRVAAEKICADATARREALTDIEGGYIENPTEEQMLQRADIVDESTLILEQMLDQLVAIPVDNDNDRDRLAVFEENYRLVLADRRRYTETLRRFELRP
ncbi:MAG: hypothetical protein Q7V62_07395, partial [Actinomycetota bacterium]|nr:hypothetical protein [Actinomycetota bacterium]